MKILFLGHSLIEFGDWQALLAGHETVNLGLAGETTAHLLGRLDPVIRAHPAADALVVMSGTNDILTGDDSFLAEYRQVAVTLRRAYPAARILLHALPPLDPEWCAPATLAAANAGIARLAAAAGVEFLDLTADFSGADGLPRATLYTEDGVHLAGAGYRAWAARLLERLGTPRDPGEPAGGHPADSRAHGS